MPKGNMRAYKHGTGGGAAAGNKSRPGTYAGSVPALPTQPDYKEGLSRGSHATADGKSISTGSSAVHNSPSMNTARKSGNRVKGNRGKY